MKIIYQTTNKDVKVITQSKFVPQNVEFVPENRTYFREAREIKPLKLTASLALNAINLHYLLASILNDLEGCQDCMLHDAITGKNHCEDCIYRKAASIITTLEHENPLEKEI